jgi:hypothetical protein
MSDDSSDRPADGHRALRGLALAAVSAGVVVLAAAAFVLSYRGIHAVALHAGVSAPLARIYPAIVDAMLVIACAAVLSLRGAGPASRVYAWVSLLVLLAAAAAADTAHSTGVRFPHRAAAATAAIVPWVLLLIGFGLLLAMLRHARLRRAAPGAADLTAGSGPAEGRPSGPVAALPAGNGLPMLEEAEGDAAQDAPQQDAPQPAFHRMWSSPIPPDEDDQV